MDAVFETDDLYALSFAPPVRQDCACHGGVPQALNRVRRGEQTGEPQRQRTLRLYSDVYAMSV